ncbi:MAG: choice-of-anchor I family protein [Burkholderiales bacterium]|nr:choice-of-anchor I family protein [Phycisphaerae bacterium]
MRTKLHALLVGTTCALLPVSAFAEISFLSGVSLPSGGEIVSYSGGSLLTTDSLSASNHAVQSYSLSSGGTLSAGMSISLNSVFGASSTASISSVLNDARGFGVATVIPTATGAGDFGRVAIFDKSTGSIIKTLDVGYHPDSVTITPDGTKLIIANEGEYGSTSSATAEAVNRAGSVSIVNISGVTSGNYSSALAALNSGAVSTYDFSAGNLASGVTLNGLRNARLDTANVKSPNAADIEPEYITATDTTAYITLQENNAIATLDLTTGKYTAINKLGTITQTIDASDRDGSGNTTTAAINDVVAGLPMPDTVVKFQRTGSTYLVTANEGDARPDDGDTFRGSQHGTVVNGSAAPSLDAAVLATVNNTGIGRLNLLKDQGDTDLDGDIDTPTMLGTRSFSIWQVGGDGTLSLAFDSDSMIEQFVLANDPTSHNINSGLTTNFDTRSDDKGPEVEAVAYASFDGKEFVFIGAERQNGIFQFDITDLNNVAIIGYYNTVTGTVDSGGAFISPESIQFLDAASNPTGKNILIVGYEGTGVNGSIALYEVTSISAIPEPASAAALLGVGALGAVMFRRRGRKA